MQKVICGKGGGGGGWHKGWCKCWGFDVPQRLKAHLEFPRTGRESDPLFSSV